MPALALTGIVTKVGFMNKTATVTVARSIIHPRTRKEYKRHKKYLTHDPENKLKMEDTVLIRNCPPVSARKRFALEKIIRSPETERLERRAKRALEGEMAAKAQEESATLSTETSTTSSSPLTL